MKIIFINNEYHEDIYEIKASKKLLIKHTALLKHM